MKYVDAIRHWVLMFSFISTRSFSIDPNKLIMSSIMNYLLYFYKI